MNNQNNIYEKIKDTITKIERSPKFRERQSEYILGGKSLHIDIPKKENIFYHGSSYIIDCDENIKRCDTRGTLVTVFNDGEKVKKNLEEFGCNIIAIHDYNGIKVRSTHVHFRCENKDYDNTIKILNFLKEL